MIKKIVLIGLVTILFGGKAFALFPTDEMLKDPLFDSLFVLHSDEERRVDDSLYITLFDTFYTSKKHIGELQPLFQERYLKKSDYIQLDDRRIFPNIRKVISIDSLTWIKNDRKYHDYCVESNYRNNYASYEKKYSLLLKQETSLRKLDNKKIKNIIKDISNNIKERSKEVCEYNRLNSSIPVYYRKSNTSRTFVLTLKESPKKSLEVSTYIDGLNDAYENQNISFYTMGIFPQDKNGDEVLLAIGAMYNNITIGSNPKILLRVMSDGTANILDVRGGFQFDSVVKTIDYSASDVMIFIKEYIKNRSIIITQEPTIVLSSGPYFYEPYNDYKPDTYYVVKFYVENEHEYTIGINCEKSLSVRMLEPNTYSENFILYRLLKNE